MPNLFYIFGFVLIVLKLMGQITISWWLVVVPFFIPIIFCATAFVFAFLILLLGEMASSFRRR